MIFEKYKPLILGLWALFSDAKCSLFDVIYWFIRCL